MKATFWLVWNPKGSNPTYRHGSEKSARDEAARLARLYPGTEFIVLKSVATAEHDAVKWEEHGTSGTISSGGVVTFPYNTPVDYF